MMTIEQIAKKMGVSKTEAYGLVRCFEAAGVLKTEGKAPREAHQRGRSSHLYRFNDEIVSQAAGLLSQLIEDEPASETATAALETAAPATETPVLETPVPAEETCTILPESAQPAAQ